MTLHRSAVQSFGWAFYKASHGVKHSNYEMQTFVKQWERKNICSPLSNNDYVLSSMLKHGFAVKEKHSNKQKNYNTMIKLCCFDCYFLIKFFIQASAVKFGCLLFSYLRWFLAGFLVAVRYNPRWHQCNVFWMLKHPPVSSMPLSFAKSPCTSEHQTSSGQCQTHTFLQLHLPCCKKHWLIVLSLT